MTAQFDHTKQCCKILKADKQHYGMTYKKGVNKDILPFNDDPKDSCCSGRLYFTDGDRILQFLSYGTLLAFVTIPESAKTILDPQGDKWGADTFIITKIIKFTNVESLQLQSIGGSAYFRDSQIKSLGQLQSIGGSVDFRNLQIKSLGQLQSIGGSADFRNLQIKSLGQLQSIGGSADFQDSQIKLIEEAKERGFNVRIL
jgi:hypothetical protein